MSAPVVCDGCGRSVLVPRDFRGDEIRCPGCGLACEVLVETSAENDDESDEALQLRNAEPKCPRCHALMNPAAGVCAKCGFDTKPRTAFKALSRQWWPGLSPQRRLYLFLASQGLALIMVIVATITGQWTMGLSSWFLFTVLLAFILGTFNVVELSRNRRGRVTLTNTWRICFGPRPALKLRLGDFDSVASGQDRDTDMWDWLMFFVLLFMGIVPGIIWWYLAIHSDRFFVALTEGHGAPKYYLYRGLSQDLAVEMAAAIQQVAFRDPAAA